MNEINSTVILDGITLALRENYPSAQIESDSVEQGLKPPAFIVLLIDSSQKRRIKQRWKRAAKFDVLYFPESKKVHEECYSVADDLSISLETITLPGGDLLRGSDISFDVIDDVLHFTITYSYYAIIEDSEDNNFDGIESVKIGVS